MSANPEISKCMSTQHPDNVQIPFFSKNQVLEGDDEVLEAFYVYSHLECREQMWDCEGKEVDNFVLKKLLTRDSQYFGEKQIGRDLFLTLRIPNPEIEKPEAKILLEALESIPRSYDLASLFYKNEQAPIYEVILPMTTSYASVDNIYQYYRDFVIGKQYKRLGGRDITIADWIGGFKPDKINVIPLFEDMNSTLGAGEIVSKYLENKNLSYQRVFLARSDPAMNYGMISAVLLNKIALSNLHDVSVDTGTEIFPIIGVGSAPFRGNLRPDNAEKITREYSGAYTFTIQSAFKYDYPLDEVRNGIRLIENSKVSVPPRPEVDRSLEIIEKCSSEYKKELSNLYEIINRMALYVPGRRRRKMHIGLFGYSRNFGGINLPRAITFTSVLYSLGVPPEILGINALDDDDICYLKEVYTNFESDLSDALKYLNPDSPYLPDGVVAKAENIVDFGINMEHKKLTDSIIHHVKLAETAGIKTDLVHAAQIRHFLG
ncbi:MAG: phosphoenolpyruvate carboxylase [Euryarchaeota archaeon]|nr:phosphoenolpyruvate carboxylase [Euryarchaeota archaeon]